MNIMAIKIYVGLNISQHFNKAQYHYHTLTLNLQCDFFGDIL